jgi:hypothetical protein
MASKRGLSPPEKLRAADKLLDMTTAGLRAAMDGNDGEIRAAVLRVRGMRGQLRLKIRCRKNVPFCWQMAVVLYSSSVDGRIDCIDFEHQFEDVNGQLCSGFHRHEWDQADNSCERRKVALPTFNPPDVAEFIRQGFELMNIKLKEDAPNDQMRTN